jgi:hypothetical protein
LVDLEATRLFGRQRATTPAEPYAVARGEDGLQRRHEPTDVGTALPVERHGRAEIGKPVAEHEQVVSPVGPEHGPLGGDTLWSQDLSFGLIIVP